MKLLKYDAEAPSVIFPSRIYSISKAVTTAVSFIRIKKR